MTDNLLNEIIKSLPTGYSYYLIVNDTAIDGPWDKEEIKRRYDKCKVEGAKIAYWENQMWVTGFHRFTLNA